MGGCLGSIRSEGHTMGARCAASAWQDWRSGPISGGQSPVSRSGALDRAPRASLAGPSGDVRELELDLRAVPAVGGEGRLRPPCQGSVRNPGSRTEIYTLTLHDG